MEMDPVTSADEQAWRTPVDVFTTKMVDPPAGRDKRSKKLRKFYEEQNKLIASFEDAEELLALQHAGGPEAEDKFAEREAAKNKTGPMVKVAINLSFAVNVFLFCFKLFAAIYSSSLAVIVSAVDSSLDLFSGSILFCAARVAAKKNKYQYPVGKSRLEPIAIVVFASVMGVAALQLVIEAITRITEQVTGNGKTIRIDAVAYAIIGTTIVLKSFLFVFCYRYRNESDSVAALAQDHFNDIATNTSTLIALILLGQYPNLWWLDPLTAILLGILIIWAWARAGKDHIVRLTGKVGDKDQLSTITYLAMNHDPRILYVDTVRAYHMGAKLLVELDIVLPEAMPLREAHDLGESLQRAVERLEFVERCYTHLDYEYSHKEGDEHVLHV